MLLPAHADDYTSSSFIVRDPVVTLGGSRETSTSFEYFSNTGQTVIGESTSTSFSYHSGFLYFPVVTSPVLVATAGDQNVALSWTASSVALGFTVSGYSVGRGSSAGGPYTFASVTNSLSQTISSLTNGSTYYFVVQTLDAFGRSIATSTEVSATPVSATQTTTTTSSGGGGGGGGGGAATTPPISVAVTGVTFTGRAYPLSKVTVLQDGQIAATTIAGPDAQFSMTVTGLSAGNYTFAVYSEDASARRSALFTFPVFLTTGVTTTVGGIFITPTIAVDKEAVKRGDNIAIFGQSVPSSAVTISVHSDQEYFVKADADSNGVYLYTYDTAPLEIGQHETKAKAALATEVSGFSQAVSFAVGDISIPKESSKCPKKADVNDDCKVNLVDFSIAAFWYNRSLDVTFAATEKAQLNDDGKVDIVDFSIMAFYWTG